MKAFKCELCGDEMTYHGMEGFKSLPCDKSCCTGISRPLTTDQTPRAEVTFSGGLVLPTRKSIHAKLENNEYVNPLEDFIYDQEPNGKAKENFRLLLQNALLFAKAN